MSSVPVFTALRPSCLRFTVTYWQAKRDSNPQPPVLETGALPVELLAFEVPSAECELGTYFVSRCALCFRQNRQYLLSSSRSVVFFRFFVVL